MLATPLLQSQQSSRRLRFVAAEKQIYENVQNDQGITVSD